MNISLNIVLALTKFSASIENILMQETMSQNFYLGLSFDLMTKTGNLCHFLLFFTIIHFLHVTKQKLGPVSKI